MIVKGNQASRFSLFTASLVVLFWSFGSTGAQAQAPYLLPYTIGVVAGGGTAPTVGAACAGATTFTAEDALGDGCPVTSSSVVMQGTNIHDVGVDPIGGVYMIDIGTNTVVRRIDPHSGIINVLAGTPSLTTVCSSATDKYGDGCPANDGKGNVGGAYTSLSGSSRGMAVAKNGDVYIADYTNSLIHKISASTGVMTVVAGYIATAGPKNGSTKGYTGDGGLATSAELNSPRGVAVDAAGNIYIADSGNNVIRMVSASTGKISTIAGAYPGSNTNAPATSPAGSATNGDGGPAASSATTLDVPEDVEIDANGNVFIGDSTNNRVRVIYAGGTQVAKLIALTNSGAVAQVGDIYTVVGTVPATGTYTAGSMMLATSLTIGNPRKLSVDPSGNLYIADNGNNVIWFVDGSTGYMRVLAGKFGATTGSTCTTTDAYGDGCAATLATLNAASNMGVGLGPQGDVYVSDSGDARLRKVALNTSFPAVVSGNSATQTLFVHFAVGDTAAATTPYVLTGSSDFAISGTPSCTLNVDTTTDCSVSILFTPTRPGVDVASFTVKSALGLTSQFELNGTGTASSVALDPGNTTLVASSLSTPISSASSGMVSGGAGNIYVADTANNRVINYTTSTVIAGTGTSGYSGDGAAATAAKLSAPMAVAVTPDGAIYIADTGNNVIRRIDPITGYISTFAGGASSICASNIAYDSYGDGCPATQSIFSAPAGIVSDSIGNLYVSDAGNNLIREISTSGYVFFVAGGATAICPRVNDTNGNYLSGSTDAFGDGCAPTQAIFKSPTALQLDLARNLYIADTGNNEVRKITFATNLVSAVAGTGQSGYSGNGGLATAAQVNAPTGIALDAAANLYIADTGNHVVRVVNASGDISTVVGTLGSNGTGTVPGIASGVLLNLPTAVVSSGMGKLSVLDAGNKRVLSVDRGSVSLNFGRTNLGYSSPATAIQETSTGSSTAALGYPLFSSTGSTAVLTLTGSGSSGCSSSSSSPQTLAPGAFCNLSAQFTPTALGALSATYTESNATTLNSPSPFVALAGTGAVLTKTTLSSAVTTPATGSPQYSIPFVVTATLLPAACDPTAPNCSVAGTITFYVDGTQVGLPVAVNNTSTTSNNVVTATATISGLSVGSHVVSAVYSGDTYYASSSASTLTVAVAQGATLTVATAAPASSAQFTNLVLSAHVTSATSTIPTGSITFYAGTTLLGSSSIDTSTGVASIQDVFATDKKGNIISVPQSFGLTAGAYNLTAVYSGDSNYATSTSAGVSLTITADPQGFAVAQCITYNTTSGCAPSVVGTAQGSTATATVYVIPSNTLNGTLSFSCSGLPANSVCTFSATVSPTQAAGSTLVFTPVAGSSVPGTTIPGATLVGGAIAAPAPALPPSVTVTLWTDVNPNVNSASNTSHSNSMLAGVLGWPMLLGGFTALLGFRKRLRNSRLFAGLALFALLAGSASVLTGCTSAVGPVGLTPVGSYTVTVTVTGPNGLVQTTPITLTVGAGLAGQM
ncbi:MAG: Ig-like domain repeat protein [Acidobacteriaceae bacterium]|nr:Ig-like domain repeat protein [Acidobacteriaceae bacterium]